VGFTAIPAWRPWHLCQASQRSGVRHGHVRPGCACLAPLAMTRNQGLVKVESNVVHGLTRSWDNILMQTFLWRPVVVTLVWAWREKTQQ